MSSAPQRYAFPHVAQFSASLRVQADKAKIEAEDRLRRETIERAYIDGFEQGRVAAEMAAKQMFEEARQRGFAAGRGEGLGEPAQAAAALRQALEDFTKWRDQLAGEAESFCVDLTLAIAARLIELDESRLDFIKRAIRAATSLLSPELPTAIFVNPANLNLVASVFSEIPVQAKDTIPPGGVRIEAGRLLVDSDVQLAFEQIKTAVLDTRVRRADSRIETGQEGASQAKLDQAEAGEGKE